jgi:hypothetical protein
MVLLISAAALLVAGKTDEANRVADYAFYSLVIGIVIQIGATVREERKRTRAGDSKRLPSSQTRSL